ncbi:MAG: hypothetical protein IBX64_02120 [Actinobacteria bacterium]|nr:hypothetical protein [Actinomycetota bacterium]
MQQITYVSGQYAQVKLDDGSKIFIETLPEKVRVKKMLAGFIPTKTLWEFQFPFYIRTAVKAWELSEEILDSVLASVEHCSNLNELVSQLSQGTAQLLNKYATDNEVRAYQVGIEKLGPYAAKKYVIEPDVNLSAHPRPCRAHA